MMRWAKVGAGFALLALAVFGCNGVPDIKTPVDLSKVCALCPQATPPPCPPEKVCPTCPPPLPCAVSCQQVFCPAGFHCEAKAAPAGTVGCVADAPPSCPPVPPCQCGEKPGELWLDQCGVAHPACAECPLPTDPSPPPFPPPPFEVNRGWSLIQGFRNGAKFCQGEQRSDNPKYPGCRDGQHEVDTNNDGDKDKKVIVKLEAGDKFDLDSTNRTGLCPAVIQAHLGKPHVVAWDCPPRDQDPCDVFDSRELCSIGDWIGITGACADLFSSLPEPQAKKACGARYPSTHTAWQVKGPAKIEVTPEDFFGARLTLLGPASQVTVMACPGDARSPLAPACVTKVPGKGR